MKLRKLTDARFHGQLSASLKSTVNASNYDFLHAETIAQFPLKANQVFTLPHQLKSEPFQVFGFRNHGDYRMIRPLRIHRHAAQDAAAIERGRQDHV